MLRHSTKVEVSVAPLSVVRAEECQYMAQHVLDGVGKSARTLINETNAVIDGRVRVTLPLEIPVRRPAIPDDRVPCSTTH
jgi:hypothetical protein